jgi:hypothetical protein
MINGSHHGFITGVGLTSNRYFDVVFGLRKRGFVSLLHFSLYVVRDHAVGKHKIKGLPHPDSVKSFHMHAVFRGLFSELSHYERVSGSAPISGHVWRESS